MRVCLCHRFGGAVGVPPGFTVADRSDQLALIAGILRGLGAAGHAVAKEDVIEFASALKNRACVRTCSPCLLAFVYIPLIFYPLLYYCSGPVPRRRRFRSQTLQMVSPRRVSPR
jgi:hypothetical protein